MTDEERETEARHALDYAANGIHKENHQRRSVFIVAYVEDEEWALNEVRAWLNRKLS